MRVYLITTATVFALIVVAHAFRIVVEGWGVARTPDFAISSLAAMALCAWAIRLLGRPQPPAA